MTTNHTELCRVLSYWAHEWMNPDAAAACKEARDMIESQAARIAELEKERDALKADAEGYRLIRAGRAYVEPEDIDGRVYVSIGEHGRYCRSADEFDAEIAAALQAEKETR